MPKDTMFAARLQRRRPTTEETRKEIEEYYRRKEMETGHKTVLSFDWGKEESVPNQKDSEKKE